jgi:hypothetical protein
MAARRRNRISGQFDARLIEMLESPAYRVLSLSAHRVIDRIVIEHAHHGGAENGRLPVTYGDFHRYGLHRHSIAPAIREAEALGFIRVTQRGRASAGEFRSPSLYLLTFVYCDRAAEPTHDWREIESLEAAEAVAVAARKARSKNKKPVPVNAISSDETITGNQTRE